jgi:hypothetical protein
MPAWIVAMLCLTAASFVFRSQIAATVLLAPYDDGLFLRLADAVGNGTWLGDYDNLTLAKGPAYPLFIALVGFLHLPLKLSEHAAYLAAAAGMALVVHRLARSGVLALVLYGTLALNPMMWSLGLARVIRDGFYVAVALGVVAIAAWLLLASVPRHAGIRVRGAPTALLAGALTGVFWLTREEGAWLVPALAVLAVGSAWRLWASSAGRTGAGPRPRWQPALALVAMRLILVAIGAGVVLGGVGVINANRYGVALTNDLTGGSFPAAYGALARIEHNATDRYVPVPASARVAAYRVSPAAAELEPFLEGESGAQWTARSCGGPPDPEKGCDDIRGGWFVWALREAVDLAGHWTSAEAAQAFLARLAREVDTACDSQRLGCGSPRASIAPPIGLDTVAAAAPHALRGLTLMTGVESTIQTGASEGPAAEVLRVALGIGPVAPLASSPQPRMQISGWVAATDGVPNIAMDQGNGRRGDAQITMDPAPDVDVFFESRGEEDFSSRRFTVITGCNDSDCHLVVRGADGDERRLRMVDLATGPILQSSTLWLFIDAVGPLRTSMEEVLHQAAVRAHPRILDAMHWLQGAFGLLLPVAVTTGLAGFGLALIRRAVRTGLVALLILAAVCLVAVAVRLFLIAVLEITSWPGAMSDVYLAPGTPFLSSFAVIGTYLGARALSDLAHDGRRHAPEPPIEAGAG